jgi:hypothetical protein
MDIAATNAAIQAIVSAHIGQFYQTTQVDLPAKLLLCHPASLSHQVFNILWVSHGEQRPIFFGCHRMFVSQLINYLFHTPYPLIEHRQYTLIASVPDC